MRLKSMLGSIIVFPARLMLRASARLTLALLAVAGSAGAESVVIVEVRVSSAEAAGEIQGFLLVGDGGSSSMSPISGLGRVEVAAPAGSVVLVTPRVDGFWGAPVAAVPGGDPVVLELFPAGEITGALEVPPGTVAPESLRASFRAPPDVRVLGAPTPEGAADCPVAGGKVWSCTLPEGVFDLRLHAQGFASVLQWDVPVQAGAKAPGGSIALVPGAAVLGQATVEGAGEEIGPVEVEIRPDGAGWRDALGGNRLGHLFRTVEVDRRGFFQFRDLSPGHYRVEARAAGRAPAIRAAIEVQEGRETDLGAPLVLRPLSRLELYLDPFEGPDGERWMVRLTSAEGGAESHAARVDWTGFGLIDGLAAGSYRYVVTSRGSTWSSGTIEVSSDVGVHTIRIPLVPVRGIVHRGGQPARARIVFGGTHEHPERIEMFADPEGRFSGHLPREDRWPAFVTVEAGGAEQGLDPVEVARAPGEEAAWLEIELFDTTVRGRVVGADGQPVSSGVVIASRSASASARRTIANLDREGRFRLRGVRPGTWTLEASVSGDSGRVVVELAEDADEEIEIRLTGTRLLAGRVTSPRGTVAAARLYVVPEIERTHPLEAIKSGPLGEFRERVPADTSLVHVLAMAPGFAARILSLDLPPGGGPVDGIDVRLGEIAGTLRLHLPEAGDGGLELRSGRSRVPLRLLADWLAFHGAPPGEIWELPAMAPGVYELCSRERCDSGTLGPGSTLALRLTPDES